MNIKMLGLAFGALIASAAYADNNSTQLPVDKAVYQENTLDSSTSFSAQNEDAKLILVRGGVGGGHAGFGGGHPGFGGGHPGFGGGHPGFGGGHPNFGGGHPNFGGRPGFGGGRGFHPGPGYRPGWGPHRGWYPGWVWNRSYIPYWVDSRVMWPGWVWIDVPYGYWQCTAFDQNMNAYPDMGQTEDQAAYDAMDQCGGEANGCYIPPGYCQPRSY